MPPEPPLLLIDSNYLGHQGRYTTGGAGRGVGLEADDGTPTGILFSFLTRILTFGKKFESNRMIFCWDSEVSLRREQFASYKENHLTNDPEKLADLRIAFDQFDILREKILPALGFRNIFRQPGLEADDLIARIAIDELDGKVIISADQDLYQCLRDGVIIYNPSSHKIITRKKFRAEYGISPSRWAMVKAIGGCSSDRVPGVTGVGEKTALRYLRGELKSKAKAWGDIHAAVLKGEIDDFLALTELPHPHTEPMPIERDALSEDGFCRICGQYGFPSLLEDDRYDEWQAFLRDNFPIETKKARPKIKVRRTRNG